MSDVRGSPLRVTLFDYGAGNLHSLVKAIEAPDVQVRLEADPAGLVAETDALVLPGVGAFSPAAARIAPARETVVDALRGGLPALCICLGMQLLFEESEEGGGAGLGLLSGHVERLRTPRIPQIGWNDVEWVNDHDRTLGVAYFANSFVCRPTAAAESHVIGWSEHDGDRFVSAVRIHETVGAQFHPEKSSTPGVHFIRTFLERARTVRTTRQAGER